MKLTVARVKPTFTLELSYDETQALYVILAQARGLGDSVYALFDALYDEGFRLPRDEQ